MSAISQHRLHCLSCQNAAHPQELFWSKPTEQINEWKEAGEQPVLGRDWNTDSDLRQIHTLKDEFNLKEAHKEMHQEVPCTRHPGSKMIDFFLTTAGSHVTKSRHTRSGGGVSKDHRAQWIEITCASALGVSTPKVIHLMINRINCQDPGVVKLFNHNCSSNSLKNTFHN